ncbi:MAG: 2'-5' RNA ligase family protein [Actinobacteria bacterium]|nr:2'-5' RNA ligase family protein [Actinomycetota bacterium]
MTRRTALIVAVPEAEAFVGEIRRAHDWSASVGVPAHITILFPFATPEDVDESELAAVFARLPGFGFELSSVERFEDGVTWLRPTPSEPFLALTGAVVRRWPEYPPYEGVHETVIPHLTVAEIDVALELDDPIRAHAHEVQLIEETVAGGRWASRATFALRSAQRGVA